MTVHFKLINYFELSINQIVFHTNTSWHCDFNIFVFCSSGQTKCAKCHFESWETMMGIRLFLETK